MPIVQDSPGAGCLWWYEDEKASDGRDTMKRFPVFRSRTARLGRTLGAIGLPVAVCAVVMHQLGGLTPSQMIWAILVAAFLGLVTLCMAACAFFDVWRKGGFGTGDALFALVYGIVALVPAAALAAGQLYQDYALDVATDPDDPPVLIRPSVTATQTILGQLALSRQAAETNDIVSRRYRIQPASLHIAAMSAARRSGWTIVSETPPDLLDAPTGFQAEARTLVLGLIEDIAVRIRPDQVGALFDMRSASRYSLQDIGGNVARIRTFYRELDEVLLQTYGEIEALTVVGDEDETEERGAVTEIRTRDPVIPVPAFKPYMEGSDEPVSEGASDSEGLEG